MRIGVNLCDSGGVTERNYVTTGAAARELNVASTTLQRWVHKYGIQPAYVTGGGHFRWDLDDLRRQLRARSEEDHTPMTDPRKPVQRPVVASILTSHLGMLVTWRNDKTPPAGFLTGEIEMDESPEDAMIRECKEEAGLVVKVGKIIAERDHPRTGRHMIYVTGEPADETDVFVGDNEELADVRWVSLAEAEEALAPFGGIYPPVREYLAAALG